MVFILNYFKVLKNLKCISKKEGQYADRLRKSTNKLGQNGKDVITILCVFAK